MRWWRRGRPYGSWRRWRWGRRCMGRGSRGSRRCAGRRDRMSRCSFRRQFFPLCLLPAFSGWRSLRKLDRRRLSVRWRHHQRGDSESRRGEQDQAKIRHDNFFPREKFRQQTQACCQWQERDQPIAIRLQCGSHHERCSIYFVPMDQAHATSSADMGRISIAFTFARRLHRGGRLRWWRRRTPRRQFIRLLTG